MAKGKKRALFTGNKPIGGPAMRSRRVARRVTSQYHTLMTEKAKLSQDITLSKEEKQVKLSEIEEKLRKIGGINKYQEASIISTQHFSTSKWILQSIRRHRTIDTKTKLKTFEVGAINTQLQSSPMLSVRSIDLHSQHPLIEEKDFFEVLPERAYDIVVCSMVINCVTDSQKRGEMIARLFTHLQPNPQSLLFLILPRRCLSSPFFAPFSSSSSSSPDGSSAFARMLQDVFGFKLVEEHMTPRVAFFVLSLPIPCTIVPSSPSLEWTEIVRESISRNVLNLADATSPSLVQLYKRVCGITPNGLPNDLKEGKSETFIVTLDASVFLSNQASRRLAAYI